MEAEKIIKALADKPLQKKEQNYLVDRENEISKLNMLTRYHPFGIFGLCGETGVGKTTILNMIDSEEIKKIRISLIHRENKESILYDLLYTISLNLSRVENHAIKNLAKEVLNWIIEEVAVIKGATLGVSMIAKGDAKYEKTQLPRFNVFAAHEKLHRLLKTSIEEYGKIALLIDELDKESKQDVLNVLDSLKFELQQESMVTIFSLPYSIYREYKQDRMKWNESGNLENIIKDVIFLYEMSDSDILELLLRRLEGMNGWFKKNALVQIVSFADGNPRDALWIAQKVAFENLSEKYVDESKCKTTIKKIVREYMGSLILTEIQKKALKLCTDFIGSKEEILALFQSSGIKRTTAYSTLDRLISSGLILEREGMYRISGKAKIFVSLI
ncbi:MAG: ATPase [Kosmotoga sp.]|uniref:P-loop NTPase fold protein n=1 Tax=Kosmotoga sp. TaxID=1955248 RepID=UPI0025C3C408|nr:P-loop NTPase fold protein [Kosmotoga sp.]MCD6160197.1 ATPase [Kosmotoga sp.]